jgi:hypothetical protein
MKKKSFCVRMMNSSAQHSGFIFLSNAPGLRGVACTIVKITVKEFIPFAMLAVDWDLEVCDSDTLL